MLETSNGAVRDRRRLLRAATACLALVTAVACAPGESAPDAGDARRSQPSREELPAGLAALLDSGTVAYRAGDFEAARRHYRAAADQAPEVASTWFGVYLAESALGNGEAADAAMTRFRELGGVGDMHHVPHGDSVPGADETPDEVMQTHPG